VESCHDHAVEQVVTSFATNVNKIGRQPMTPKKPSVETPPKIVGFLGPQNAVFAP
jgi:hypothetical protein